MNTEGSDRRVLGVFTLAMINVAAICSLRSLPGMAEYGLALAFYYVVAAFLFLIPSSLVSAELATGWPTTGGVYDWVKEAFGPRAGLVAIWLQWINNVCWFPMVLSFAAATLAFMFDPSLAADPFYTLAVILIIYWGATFINFMGMKASGLISTVGVIAGTIVPGAAVIVLGAVWLITGHTPAYQGIVDGLIPAWWLPGHTVQIGFTWDKLIPDMSSLTNLVLASGTLLGFAGMEMSAVHAREVQDPQRNYPRAILLSALIIVVLFILGALAVAVIVPHQSIHLVDGVMQAFRIALVDLGLGWAVPVIALLVAVGAMAGASTWIVGPSKGLFASAKDGLIPPFFQKLNTRHIPVNMLLIQGAIVTIYALVVFLSLNVNTAFWILGALTSQLYLIMYILMFGAAIRLRYSRPDVPRAYRVPGGNPGMWLAAGVGVLGSMAAIGLGFLPLAGVQNKVFYVAFLVIGVVVLTGAPLVMYALRRPAWRADAAT
jgi:amino acid transporter